MLRQLTIIALLLALPRGAGAQDVSSFQELRAADLHLNTLGDRLARSNERLCDRQQPATGLVVQALDAFAPVVRDTVRNFFGFATSLAIEAVVPGSAADRGDIRANDAIEALNGERISAAPLALKATIARLADFQARLAALPAGRPISMALIRNGIELQRTINPPAECRGRFELLVSSTDESTTSNDGTTVRISSHLLAKLSDQDGAVVLAHELAHLILHHEERLAQAGVHGGLVGGLGRNVRYFRETETEADILSVDLLANAGFPPIAAAEFWRGPGRRLSAFTDRSHPAAADRAATTAQEAAAISADPGRVAHPPILAGRDQPLTGDWQTILVRAR